MRKKEKQTPLQAWQEEINQVLDTISTASTGLTFAEISELFPNTGKMRLRRALAQLVKSGKLRAVHVMRPNIFGRMQQFPVYLLQETGKKK